ncbi:hypothetical protein Hanom_Chr06g00512981 [Helianthus anomalus]
MLLVNCNDFDPILMMGCSNKSDQNCFNLLLMIKIGSSEHSTDLSLTSRDKTNKQRNTQTEIKMTHELTWFILKSKLTYQKTWGQKDYRK